MEILQRHKNLPHFDLMCQLKMMKKRYFYLHCYVINEVVGKWITHNLKTCKYSHLGSSACAYWLATPEGR